MKSINWLLHKNKNSLYIKVFSSIFIIFLAVIIFVEASNIYVLTSYRKRAENTYQSSLKLYTDYWDAKLEIINNTLLSTITRSSENYYLNILHSDNQLTVETSKVLLLQSMDEIVTAHGNLIDVFCYMPTKQLYMKSTNHILESKSSQMIQQSIVQYIAASQGDNSHMWQFLKINDEGFLIQIYAAETAYIGAIIHCDSILESLMDDAEIVGAAALISSDELVYEYSYGMDLDFKKDIFTQELSFTNYEIAVNVSSRELYNDNILFVVLLIGIVMIGLLFIGLNMRLQTKIVLSPLDKLKKAMLQFSEGQLDVRINEAASSEEINTLYQTFNYMASEIKDLKIDVYESEIRNQEINRQFLQVQIQPHFYTNILNLIYGLAQVHQYQEIQKLSMETASYFRYLLNHKDRLVPLQQEINCVNSFVEIQKTRYPDMLRFEIQIEASCQTILLPPLLIQTFVENSIKHNITLVPMLEIKVRLSKKNDNILLEILDNGVGFPLETIKRINNEDDISSNGQQIGITNVMQRLKLVFGENTVLTIKQQDDTKIHVVFPFIEEIKKEGPENELADH